jgi:hypothetical protein
VQKQELVWPELIRLVIQDKLKKPDSLPLEKEMDVICQKLSRCRPEAFAVMFTFDEKVELFSHLIDMVHELDEFRNFLNQRIEEKSQINKQKLDIHLEIKQLEN